MKRPRIQRMGPRWLGKRPIWSIRRRILDFVRDNPGATFKDLEALPGAAGQSAVMFGPNVLLWGGLSEKAGDAVAELLQQGVLEARAVNFYAYTKRRPGEGIARIVALPALPLLREENPTPLTPHWFPTALYISETWAESADAGRAN